VPKPVPVADEASAFYWDAAARGQLAVQRCATCGAWHYPPVRACPRCQGEDLQPTEVAGSGTVYTFVVVRQAFDPAFAADLPYVVAMVALDEDPGLRLLTNIVGVAPEQVRVGMPVRVAFEQRDGVHLPVFRPC